MTLAVRDTAARTLDTAPAAGSPPGPGEVEPAPAHVGVCGTDLHIVRGDMDALVRMPAVPWHWMCGRVIRVGAEVEGWVPGDAVTVCRTVPASTRIRLSDTVALDPAALVEPTGSPCATWDGLP